MEWLPESNALRGLDLHHLTHGTMNHAARSFHQGGACTRRPFRKSGNHREGALRFRARRRASGLTDGGGWVVLRRR